MITITTGHTDLLFHLWPYAALAVFGAGLLLRYLFSLGRMDAVADQVSASWAAARRSKLLFRSLLLLALAHLVGLVLPRALMAWNRAPSRLFLLEALGFGLGLVALGGWGRVTWRHLDATPAPGSRSSLLSKLAEVTDSIFLSLVLVGLGSGLATAAAYRWASSWSLVTLTPYTVSLLHGQPLTAYVGQLPYLVQLHVVSAFAALAVLPFTRLAPFPILAIHRALVFAGRPLGTAGRALEVWLRRHNPGVWIWPKED